MEKLHEQSLFVACLACLKSYSGYSSKTTKQQNNETMIKWSIIMTLHVSEVSNISTIFKFYANGL